MKSVKEKQNRIEENNTKTKNEAGTFMAPPERK